MPIHDDKPSQRDAGLRRRDFLRGAAVGLGLGLAPLRSAWADEATPGVRRRVRLGRTGLEIADVSFGASRLRDDEALVEHALARGINYFDTAESYTRGNSETTLGRALKGHREQVVLASKQLTRVGMKPSDFMESLEGSLKRLQTDRIDIYFNHSVNSVGRIADPAWGEFIARAKEQGKIRFSGMSGHSGKLVDCLEHAIDHDLVDVILVAYNFGQDPRFYEKFTKGLDFVARQPELPRILEKARAKDIGVVAMKTLLGARLNDMRPYESGGATFAQAAFRWVLSSPLTDALIVSMQSPAQVDEYLGASGWTAPAVEDAALLERYLAAQSERQCRYGCSDCTDACSAGVPISDVLRARMYDRDYGDPALARETYAALSIDAGACAACLHTSCAKACGYGLSIPDLTRATHTALYRG